MVVNAALYSFEMRVLLWLVFLGFVQSTAGQATAGTPAANQLKIFKNSTNGPIGILTLTTGQPVPVQDLSTLNIDLIRSKLFLEQQSALNRQNIPLRFVHGKAAGAFGYFKVTHDVTSITNVAFLSEVGKTTKVVARLSPARSEQGSPDTLRGPFGFAAKFYTEEGNYDFLGITTDTFVLKDPLYFIYNVHANSRNPKTNIPDLNAQFDFLSYIPEAFNNVLQVFGDIGVPASYRNIQSYSIHTFQVENDQNQVSFVRFKLTPDLGVKTLNQSETIRLSGSSPNLFIEDLYNSIGNGEYPSWTFGMQVISEKDVFKALFDIFDVTFRWPEDKYHVQPIGKIFLNRNPDDHFRDIEQLAFSPANLVPGIQGLDKVWEGRLFAYRDAALHRLGVNFNNIKVNCPMNQVFTYTRDGQAPVRDTFGGSPNYYPNSFNGPVPAEVTRTRTKRVKVYTDPSWTNAGQIADYYNGLPEDSRERLVENFSNSLALAYPQIQAKILEIFGRIDGGLRSDMERGLANAVAATATGEPANDYNLQVPANDCNAQPPVVPKMIV